MDPTIEDTSLSLWASDDSAVAVGLKRIPAAHRCVHMDPDTRMVKLSDYLTSIGITGHERWTLVTAHNVSPDGKIIAGTGVNNAANRIEGFVVSLP